MASMRDIKKRKSRIQSTLQITKAMKLVSTVKLQKAKKKSEEIRPYFNDMYRTVSSILKHSGNRLHPYRKAPESSKKAVVVITSNRGLAGGYNANVVRLITESDLKKEDVSIYAVGHKGQEALERKGYSIVLEASEVVEEPVYEDAAVISDRVLKAYQKEEIGEIYLAYTHFTNTISREAKLVKLLPVDIDEAAELDSDVWMSYEPNEEEVLSAMIPKYVTSLIYGALVESAASENAARMQEMDAASKNAEEMIRDLSLKYNRVRQGAITQELTEIIAGASAIT